MKLSPSSFICLSITLVGLLRSIQLYLSSTQDLRVANEQDPWFFRQPKTDVEHSLTGKESTPIGNQPEKIFYFVQVSDLHISKFQPKGHTIHFLHFLQSVLPHLKPEFVVITGDLIDAKDATKTVSAQYREEWQVYRAAIDQSANGTVWYDMRGNHDCFDLTSWQAENNYYREFGESSQLLNEGKGVYSWQISKPFGEYNFVAVDACPKKGPSRPFNFFGYLTTNTMNRLASSILSKTYNHTFMFGHYPTTTLVPGVSSEGYTFSDLANRFSIYFCGHLHRLTAGLGDVLKSYNRGTDSLELELSDMKDHGSYRIVAIDHDLISFVDVDLPIADIPPATQLIPLNSNGKIIWPRKLKTAPTVLITNPKDSRYTLPTKEPLASSHHSSHIRFLVFSEYEHSLLKVRLFVDDKHHPFPAEFVGHSSNLPLWTSVWEPNDFNDFATHTLRVEVTAPNGQIGTHQISFRMDNMRVKIQGGAGEWIVWSDIASLLRFLSLFALAAMLMTLIVPKVFNDYEQYSDHAHTLRDQLLLCIHEIDAGLNRSIYANVQRYIYTWTHRFLQFPEVQPNVWYLCFGLLLSLLTLPWFKTELIPSGREQAQNMGYFYLWALMLEPGNQWIPLADTWMYAIFEVTFTVAVFILYFVWKSTDAYQLHCKGNPEGGSIEYQNVCDRIWFQVLVLIYWLWRFKGLTELAVWYGGAWPTLVFNVLVWWLLAVLVVLIMGKQGIMSYVNSHRRRQAGAQPVSAPLAICSACCNAVGDVLQHPSDTNLQELETSNSQPTPLTVSTSEEESRRLIYDESGSDSSSTEARRAFRRSTLKKD
ncbi:Metallo-dependent phosphatase-like protein [Choanephora cucurbitarum]|nr:Metallo-dependent phosphatase-like protein [Choanephora cucurbitarum]